MSSIFLQNLRHKPGIRGLSYQFPYDSSFWGDFRQDEIRKTKTFTCTNFCRAEAISILQVSGSPVFLYLLGKVSCVSHQGPPLILTQSLNWFGGRLFGTSNAH